MTAPRLVPRLVVPRAMAQGFAAVVVVLAVVPWLGVSPYQHNQLTQTYILIAGALAWNWMGGFVGQISFGHAVMFGLGGFVAARGMLDAHLPAPLCWLFGALVAGAFALGAHPLLRLRGPYFSIATIGVGEGSRVVFTYSEKFTGGASGVSLPFDATFKYQLYWWALGLTAAVAAASIVIRRSSFGLRLLAIKADVDAAADVGISATLYQDLIFVLSGAVVGLTGAIHASFIGFIEPRDMFGFDRSIGFMLMAVIGGMGTSLGPALGAAAFVIVQTSLLGSLPQLHLGIWGALLIIIILFEPLGLTGLGRRIGRLVPPRRRSQG